MKNKKEKIQLDRAHIEAELLALSRSPFREVLATLLECTPSADSIREWARRQPDRWSQSLAIAGRLCGYSDKLQIDSTIETRVHAMSDAEIQHRLEKVTQQLAPYQGGNASEDKPKRLH